MSQSPHILVADDEPVNLEIIQEYLADEHYQLHCVADGELAWQALEAAPRRFNAVLLDRMMPRLDGLAVLARMQRHPTLRDVPVIVQTALSSSQDVLDGLQAGAHYYLAKPFDRAMLCSLVRAAVADNQRYRALQDELAREAGTVGLLQSAHFRLRTLSEAKSVAALLARACPVPDAAITGLSELLINAVEHGNLGVGYDEKSRLLREGRWLAELERRLALPLYAEKYVDVRFERQVGGAVLIIIKDQGAGFDWKRYMELAPERAFDNHGRGIVMAQAISFDRVEFRGSGAEVVAYLAPPDAGAARG